AGHSGGESFLFGFLDAVDAVPSTIQRIILLDANYAYSDQRKHGDKLLGWLRADANHKLIAIAYDDREITLNGKKVVSPTGGTYRASQRMIDRFSLDVPLAEGKIGAFIHRQGLGGQIEFFIHPNRENKILHTALVGEMNGLLHGLTLGTGCDRTWGQFGGPRAYTKWVQSKPAAEPAAETLKLPPRPADAPTGS